jgi:hypothetical protein
VSERPSKDTRSEPTPGERLLYALGQLYRRWRRGLEGSVPPYRIDVEAVAKFLGVWADVEFVQEDEDAPTQYLHFPTEVLLIDQRQEFPWQLLTDWEWGKEQEYAEFWRNHH